MLSRVIAKNFGSVLLRHSVVARKVSVRLSNAWIVTTEEISVQIFITYERAFSLVF